MNFDEEWARYWPNTMPQGPGYDVARRAAQHFWLLAVKTAAGTCRKEGEFWLKQGAPHDKDFQICEAIIKATMT